MSTSTPSGATGAKTSKKARTAASAGPRDAISRPRTWKRLPSLHEMPFDISLEILLQIDPKGLINLARTNKDARKALVNPNMEKTLWKRVREESEATEPPPGWSEAKWISFLFVSFCFSCGKANATNVFYILKRLCNACKKAGLVAEWALPRSSWLAPGEAVNNDSYLAHDYVLYTWYRQSIRRGSDTSKYYWNADLNTTLSAWKALCANHPGGRAVNTVKELVEFKEERKAYVRDIQRTALKMVKWEEKAHRQRRNYLASNKELLVASIRKRFADLGIYKQEDIEKAINMKTTGIGGSAATEVTNRTWKTWRAKLEPSITRIRDTRVRGIRQIRMDKILDQWDTWLASLPLPAFERLTYPDSRDIWHLPEVISIREANPDTIIDDSAYHAIFNRFPNIASSFVSNKRIQLREMVPDWGRHPTDLDPLELATSVFTAPKGMEVEFCGTGPFATHDSAVVGWKSLSICECAKLEPKATGDMPAYGERPILPVFNSLLSEVARSFVQLCGLDPAEATIEDIDRLDERFVCCTCASTLLRDADHPANELVMTDLKALGAISVKIYSWRNALNHARSCGDDRSKDEKMWGSGLCDLKIPAFRKLSDLRVASIRDVVDAQERKDSENEMVLYLLGEWSCNHCLEQLGKCRDQVFEPLEGVHGVPNPVLDKDYFTNPFKPNFGTDCCRLSLKVRSA